MIISFETHDLHDCCCRIESAEEKFGSIHAQALATLIADAEAFESAAELIDFLGPDANLNQDDSLSVAIGSDYQAKFVAAGVRFARSDEGRVIWSSVQRLKLVEISP